MAESLNFFPPRAAIGTVDGAGRVYMTPEFARAVAALLVRVGGAVAPNLDDLAIDLATSATASGLANARRLTEIDLQLAQAVQLVARLAELRKQAAALEQQLVNVAPPTDWEHPGKIGAGTPNVASFSSVNKVKITAPVGSATLTLADGKTFTVSNTLTLAGTDGSTLTIGAGGTLGSAAYKNTTDFAARTNTALAPVATDATSTQTLANSLRAALISVGIGS